MPSRLDLIVFDMDGVLANLDRPRRLALLSGMTGKDPAFLQAAIWDSDFERAAEAGAYPTGAEYLAELNRRTHSRLSRAQWVQARRDAMTIDARMVAIAEALQGRCGIAVLTNNGSLLLESLPEVAPEIHRVFGARAHASFQFAARKPQPEVFARLLARYGVAATRALFIDDEEAFVAGARRVGMHGIRHTGPRPLLDGLAAFGLPLDLP
jgi:HAD superfamily hydrolase (TIGR01509 family)